MVDESITQLLLDTNGILFSMRYNQKKKYKWSKDIAYLVGLFTADGNLSKDGRHLNITSKDIEIIKNVKAILGKDTPEKIKHGAFKTPAYYIQFSDVSLYDFMKSVGLYPNKSLTIGRLDIPNNYFLDFLRGLFDGDGTIYGYKDKRWPASYMYYTAFASGSRTFLEWLQLSINRLVNMQGGTMSRKRRALMLTYAKSDTRRLFDAMYVDSNGPMLTRKYDKFVAFFASDPYARK